jgi:hypothetical protein
VGPILVGLIAVVASAAGLRNQFVYDDVSIIEANQRLHDLGNWFAILTSPYWPPPFAPELYRPLSSLLFALEWTLGGGDPLIFRIVCYALYAATSVAVFALAKRVVSPFVALAVGALFAAHPVHVEAVALGVNQSELLVSLIAVWSVIFYIDRRRAGTLATSDWRRLAVAYGAAALIKEHAFILPGLLLAAELFVIDSTHARERFTMLWRGYASLIAVGVSLLVMRFLVLQGSVLGAVPAGVFKETDAFGRVLTMLAVVPTWLRLLVWPAHLQIDYSPNEIVASTGFGFAEAAGLSAIIAAMVLAFALRKRIPGVSFGLAWFAIALFPVSNFAFPTGIILAERTLLLPSVGFVIAVGAVVDALLTVSRARVLSYTIATACFALVALGVLKSARRQQTYRNSHRLWLTASVDAPKSLRIQRAHREAVDDMVRDYELRIAASSQPWQLRNELAVLLRVMGADSVAARQFRRSLEANPNQPDVRLELGATLLFLGDYRQAKQVADSALATDSSVLLRRLAKAIDSASAANAPPRSVRF